MLCNLRIAHDCIVWKKNFEWATKVTREKMSPPSTFDITSLTQTSVKKNQSFLHWKCNFCSKIIKLSLDDIFNKSQLSIPIFRSDCQVYSS